MLIWIKARIRQRNLKTWVLILPLFRTQTSCISWASHSTSLCLSDLLCPMGRWMGHLRILLPHDAALPGILGCESKCSFTTVALQLHGRRGFAKELSTRMTRPLLSREAENQGNQNTLERKRLLFRREVSPERKKLKLVWVGPLQEKKQRQNAETNWEGIYLQNLREEERWFWKFLV